MAKEKTPEKEKPAKKVVKDEIVKDEAYFEKLEEK